MVRRSNSDKEEKMTYVSTHAASSLFGWKDRKKKIEE